MGNQRGKKTQKKGVGIDFKRAKTKLGKKLPPPENATKTSFRSKSIVVPAQSMGQEKNKNLEVSQRNLTLKEILSQCSHYSPKVRKDALVGLKEIVSKNSKQLTLHSSAIFDEIVPKISDVDKNVRETLLNLFKSSIFPNLSQSSFRPFFNVFFVHICSAMTHLTFEIRLHSIQFLNILVLNYPELIQLQSSDRVIMHFASLLKTKHNFQNLNSLLECVHNYLLAVLSEFKKSKKIKKSSGAEYTWGENQNTYISSSSENFSSHAVKFAALHCYKNAIKKKNYFQINRNQNQNIKKSQINKTSIHPNQNDSKNSKNFENKKKFSSPDLNPSLDAKSNQNLNLSHNSIVRNQKMAQILIPLLFASVSELLPYFSSHPPQNVFALQSMQKSIEIAILLFRNCIFGQKKFEDFYFDQLPISKSSDARIFSNFSNSDAEMTEWSQNLIFSRQLFFPELLKKVQIFFPITAPSVFLPEKILAFFADLNILTCELLTLFLPPVELRTRDFPESYKAETYLMEFEKSKSNDGLEEGKKEKIVDKNLNNDDKFEKDALDEVYFEEKWMIDLLKYYDAALQGNIIPSSQFSETNFNENVLEKCQKKLLTLFPRVIYSCSQNDKIVLLTTFTKIFNGGKIRAGLRNFFLSIMQKIFQQIFFGQEFSEFQTENNFVFEVISDWIKFFPKILWNLKQSNLDSTNKILHLILLIAQRSPSDSLLFQQFSSLQIPLIPFFCISSPSIAKSSAATTSTSRTNPLLHFGPFIHLPPSSQSMAISILSFFPSLSLPLLSALSHCVFSFSCQPSIVLQTMELVKSSFQNGRVAMDHFLSFCFTLLLSLCREDSKEEKKGKRKDKEVEKEKKETGEEEIRVDRDLNLKGEEVLDVDTGMENFEVLALESTECVGLGKKGQKENAKMKMGMKRYGDLKEGCERKRKKMVMGKENEEHMDGEKEMEMERKEEGMEGNEKKVGGDEKREGNENDGYEEEGKREKNGILFDSNEKEKKEEGEGEGEGEGKGKREGEGEGEEEENEMDDGDDEIRNMIIVFVCMSLKEMKNGKFVLDALTPLLLNELERKLNSKCFQPLLYAISVCYENKDDDNNINNKDMDNNDNINNDNNNQHFLSSKLSHSLIPHLKNYCLNLFQNEGVLCMENGKNSFLPCLILFSSSPHLFTCLLQSMVAEITSSECKSKISLLGFLLLLFQFEILHQHIFSSEHIFKNVLENHHRLRHSSHSDAKANAAFQKLFVKAKVFFGWEAE